jgi:serine/threonine-protein kinase
MKEPHDPSRTVDVPAVPAGNEPHDTSGTVDIPSVPADSLDAGLAAGFAAPRSSLGEMRPVLLKEAEGESAHIVQPKSDAMPPKEETGDRYQLQGEIARGGMGAVLRGRDVDLGRDLAVKVLLEKHAHRPEVVRRFLDEAQVGAQLQHPGVVPVYDIGRFGDRPFFTMKLVKGQTLQALLAERADPAADRPHFLAIALQVAQTLAYAHVKGVIHRDLKPANIMVGAFGEVQVMDWGLAKVLAEGGVADEERASRQQAEQGTLIRTARSSGTAGGMGTDTEAGALLGTPAYMPPEQANGDVVLLDRRADVFGLGALLCEILTGKPPYVGRSAEEVRRKAANGDLKAAESRLDDCRADAELVALTRACLAPEAADRPRDAQAVAEALTAYLDGVQERLHQAELAEAEARARAVEEARRRRLTLALAATILLAFALGGGGWLWWKSDRDARQAALTREVNDALNQATALREKTRVANVGGAALFAQAREQAQRALALVQSGPVDEALLEQVRRLQAELDEEEADRALVAALDEARLAQAESAASKTRFAEERAVPKFREALRAYGMPAGEGEPAEAAARIRSRPAAVREAILAALNEWDDLAGNPTLSLDEPHRAWLRAVLEAAEPQAGWTRGMRAASAEKEPAKRRAALEKLTEEADVRTLPAHSLRRLAARLRWVGTAESAVRLLRRARDRHPADFWVNHDLGTALQALRPPDWEEAVRFLTAALALRPHSPGAHCNLGNALLRKGQVDEAIACYQKAIALDPKFALAHNNLGAALLDRGKVDEAIERFKKAIALDPKLAEAHNNLGNALKSKGREDEAIACYRKAIALDPKFATAHYNLGVALEAKGKVEGAIACYHKAITLDPKFAIAHCNLGVALEAKGKVEGAIACYHKAIALDPKFALAHFNLGTALKAKGKVDEAIACYHKAIALDPKFAVAHFNLGVAWKDKGQVDEAIICWRKAIALDPKLARAHTSLGVALKGKGKVDEAIACHKKAIELNPKFALAHCNLGNALKGKGKVDEAIACFRKAIEIDPKLPHAHSDLGHALAGKGKADEAISCYRKAIALDAKDAKTHYNLGNALAGKGKVDEAIACLRRAIALDPNLAEAHCNLGHALGRLGRFIESLAALQRGHELGTKRPGWPYPSAVWLRQAEHLAALERKLPTFLKGDFKPKDTAERLGLIAVCQAKKLHHTAARLYADAFAAELKLAADLGAAHRYNAACAAALAAAGKGEDAARLDDEQRLALRRQALTWLRAELRARQKQLKSWWPGQAAQARAALTHWQQDSDLAGIRDKEALAKLAAEERAACERLWADVAALVKKADKKTK